jgi:predicted Zn finger-like uncharacterized protein
MRLICPNCDAEYQVDDAAIPEAGRDVQCSNCGHAWFQLAPEVEIAREAEAELFGDAPIEAPIVSSTSAASVEPAASVASESKSIEEEIVNPVDDSNAPVTGPRQTLAESVLSVLREEADRETAVRRDEDPIVRPMDRAASVETQTEFGLDDAGPSTAISAAARHIAKLKAAEPDPTPIEEPKSAARRDLLPDIEEINSTLRTDRDRAQDDMDEVDALPDLRPRRRGFRSGFVLMMIVAVALAMTYIMAPRIIAQIPGTAPGLRAYVSTVDQGRLWLDGAIKSAGGTLRDLSGGN